MSDLKEKAKDSSETKSNKIKNSFRRRRTFWVERLKELSVWLKDSEKIHGLQTEVFADMMTVNEEKAKLVEAMVGISKNIKIKKAEALIRFKTDLDLKLKNQTEQNIFMEAELSDYSEKEELVEMQLEFLDKTHNNLKDLGWAIKNYIDLAKLGLTE